MAAVTRSAAGRGCAASCYGQLTRPREWSDQASRWNPGAGPDECAGRTLLRLPAGPPRRRRDQGRGAGRRPRPAARRLAGAQRETDGRVVPRPERGKALRCARFQERAGQGFFPGPRRHGGRAGRELPPRRDGAARPRLRSAEGGASRPRLLRHIRLRADRSAPRQPGLRPDHPGPVRDHEHHRHPGDGAAARRLPGLRHAGRSVRRLCGRRGAVAAGEDGAGRLARRFHAGVNGERARLAGFELPDRRGGGPARSGTRT